MANEEKIRAVVDLLERKPEKWDQTAWLDYSTADLEYTDEARDIDIYTGNCGTRACVAGHTVLMAGYRIDDMEMVRDGNGDLVGSVLRVAKDILGLDLLQAERIFDSETGFTGKYDTIMKDGVVVGVPRIYEIAELKRIITIETGIIFNG
jgi:hypothetical protein